MEGFILRMLKWFYRFRPTPCFKGSNFFIPLLEISQKRRDFSPNILINPEHILPLQKTGDKALLFSCLQRVFFAIFIQFRRSWSLANEKP